MVSKQMDTYLKALDEVKEAKAAISPEELEAVAQAKRDQKLKEKLPRWKELLQKKKERSAYIKERVELWEGKANDNQASIEKYEGMIARLEK